MDAQPTTQRLAPSEPTDKELTPRQALFIHHLSEDKRANAKQAAIKAGYDEGSAATQAWRMLRHPDYRHVQKAYDRLVEVRMAKYNVTEESIIRELAAIAFADKRDVATFGPQGVRLAVESEDLWPEQVAQIRGLTQVETEFGPVVNVQFYSKLEALVALAKIRGMLREKHEFTLDLRIQAAAGRATAALQAALEREAQESPMEPDRRGQAG